MSRRPVVLLGGMVASLTAIVGFTCLGSDDDAEVVGGDHAVLGPPEVVVAFRGVAPFERLEYRPTEGARRDFAITLRDTSSMSAAGQVLADVDREATFEVRGTIDDVLDDGAFRWEWRIRATTVSRDRAEGSMAFKDWTRAVKSMKGLEGWAIVEPSGRVRESGRDAVGGGTTRAFLGTTLGQLLSEPGIPLPATEVGRGCIWEVRRHVLAADIETRTVERFEVRDEGPGRLDLVMRGTATGALGDVAGGGFVDELLEFEGVGGGEWTLGLTGALEVSGEAWSDQTARVGLGVQGLQLGSDSVAKTDISIRPL